MLRKIVVTSGKGGVGKTTVVSNLGLQLAKSGMRVALIDCDFGLNNLDVVSCIEDKIVFDLVDVLNGRCRAKQALIQSDLNGNLFVMPCAHNLSNMEVTGQNLKAVLESIESLFDYMIFDCPAGIDLGFHRAVSCVDEGIVVVTPSLSSIRDANKVISILKTYKLSSIKCVVNRIRGDLVLSGEMYSSLDIENTLKVPIVGVIPEDDSLFEGVVDTPNSASSKAFKILANNVRKNEEKTFDYVKKYTGFWGSIRKELKKRL